MPGDGMALAIRLSEGLERTREVRLIEAIVPHIPYALVLVPLAALRTKVTLRITMYSVILPLLKVTL